jgi:uncharacterized membrane protein
MDTSNPTFTDEISQTNPSRPSSSAREESWSSSGAQRRRRTARFRAGSDAQNWERIACGVVGSTLVVAGARRRSWAGAVVALAGVELLRRAGMGEHVVPSRWQPRSRTRVARRQPRPQVVEISRSITIQRDQDEIRRALQDPGFVSQVMAPFASVQPVGGDGRSHWTFNAPIGVLRRRLAFDSQMAGDDGDNAVRWQSSNEAGFRSATAAELRAAPADWGTELTLRMRIEPPGGSIGAALLRLIERVPDLLTDKGLRRFKALIETGEIPTLAHNPSARGVGDLV